jgi:hypothetical protein
MCLIMAMPEIDIDVDDVDDIDDVAGSHHKSPCSSNGVLNAD